MASLHGAEFGGLCAALVLHRDAAFTSHYKQDL